MDPNGPYGYIYGSTIPFEQEQFEIAYQDPRPGSKMSFERKNYFMFVNEWPEGSVSSYLKTKLANLYYGFDFEVFYPTSFHVHYTTEHFFNGEMFEISMHTNHYTGVVTGSGEDLEMFTHSFSFDSKKYDRSISQEEQAIINNFFEDLNLMNRSSTANSS
mmetsp:Transcript_202/g.173  ORF Transcript_202/g.173 Transcript_202/m.173 type:complete len:160 (+) Transcript_202:196-675(+)